MRTFGWGDFVFLLLAMRWTLVLSAGAFLFGGIIGLVIALARVSPRWPLRWLAIGYIRLLQGTPLLLQLFLVFFGADLLGFDLGPYLSAILGLSLNAGAFLGKSGAERSRPCRRDRRRPRARSGWAMGRACSAWSPRRRCASPPPPRWDSW